MLNEMKEQKNEQQAWFDRNREQATLDHNNAIRKKKVLRKLNNKL